MSATKRYGVRLTLPGAPNEPHEIPGLHVPVYSGRASALDSDDDVARARELADAGAPIEVIEIDDQLTGDALKQRAADLNIEGRSQMNAEQLRAAVAAAENSNQQEGENGA